MILLTRITLKTQVRTKDMNTRLTQENLARYIPDLWRYGTRLCASEQIARDLVCDTLDTALQKQWKRPNNLSVDAWLNMVMYRVFLTDYNRYSMGKHDGTPNAWFRPTANMNVMQAAQ